MVYDNIKYIESYCGLSGDIRLGLEYLRELKSNAEVGVFELSPRVKVIVSEYTTMSENESGYEAHRQFIDIHYLISGYEKIYYLPIDCAKAVKAYNEDIDAAFYEANGVKPQELVLGNGYFSIFFMHDGHMPQLCIDKPEHVKKVVIKVRIG